MAEYIDREAALMKLMQDGCNAKNLQSISDIPGADVVPVVHGRWRESGPWLECQSCGEIYSRIGGNAGKLWNYCPNCGANTDGGADNNGNSLF